jgi:hypothetical protein
MVIQGLFHTGDLQIKPQQVTSDAAGGWMMETHP